MTRALFNLFTALWLLLCVAVLALWVRSHYAFDRLDRCRLTNAPGLFRWEECAVRGWRGTLGVSFIRHDFKPPPSPDPVNAALYTEMYNRSLAQLDSIGNAGWVRTVQPPEDCPFGDGFTGRTLREGDAIHRGWGVEWTMPYWFVFLICTLPVGVRVLWAVHGRRQCRRRGLCLACGYDLRATPGRCPECGTPTPAPTKS